MQTQQVPPYTDQPSPVSPMDSEGDQGHKSKSVMGKMKDKAKKLKTKIRKPKSPGATGENTSSSSSSEEDSQPATDERDMAVKPGMTGESYEAIPDPHTDPSAGVGEKFGQMNLEDDTKFRDLKEDVPAAAGHKSAGGLGFTGTPVEEGKTAEGEDLLVKDPDEKQPSSTTDKVVEGTAAAAGAGAAALGLKPRDENDERGVTDPSAPGNKSVLQQLQETAAGATAAISSKLGYGEGATTEAGGDGKSYTQQAREAAFGIKDAAAAKLGYGGAAEGGAPASETGKTYYQQAQEAAVGAKDAVAAKVQAYTATDEQGTPTGAAARFHPGDEDRALSQLITEKMSTGATTMKDTLMRPFSPASKTGSPTPITTPPPSSAAAMEADPSGAKAGEETPGLVGKMTGAVSSWMASSPSGKKEAEEAAGKATQDYPPTQ